MILALLLTSALVVQSPEPALAAADATALIDTGLKAFARGRFASAANSFEQAVAAAPESAAAHYYLGYSVYKTAEGKRRNHPDKTRAQELFSKALQLDPAFRPVWARPATPPPAQ